MYCKLIETEINDCIHRYLEDNFNLPADREIQISYTSSRGSDGLMAEINIPLTRKNRKPVVEQAEPIKDESDPPFENKEEPNKPEEPEPEEKKRPTLFSRMQAP